MNHESFSVTLRDVSPQLQSWNWMLQLYGIWLNTLCIRFSKQILCFSRRNRDRKQELEMDWSDKKEADEIDSFCGSLRNEHTCKQFHAGSAKFQEM